MKRKCPYCRSAVPFWSVIKPGIWGNDKIKCVNCNKELSRLWTMESLTVVAIFTSIQIALIVIAEKYLTFGFFANIALFVFLLLVVVIVGSVAIYFIVPFKGQPKNR
jgi:prepilin signal peptidase PulO-like enzyme (type II secretory pathway)